MDGVEGAGDVTEAGAGTDESSGVDDVAGAGDDAGNDAADGGASDDDVVDDDAVDDDAVDDAAGDNPADDRGAATALGVDANRCAFDAAASTEVLCVGTDVVSKRVDAVFGACGDVAALAPLPRFVVARLVAMTAIAIIAAHAVATVRHAKCL